MVASDVEATPVGTKADPLTLLYENQDIPHLPLPQPLTDFYDGDLAFPTPCLYANFVSSIDGVATLGPEYPSSGSTISGRAPADRAVMALLRACAHAVLIGAGTLRASPRHLWLPDHVYPTAAAAFATVRNDRHLQKRPELVVVTATGDVPPDHPAIKSGALIATTKAGAATLRGRLPETCTVVSLADGPTVPAPSLIQALHDRGHTTILSEAGPRLLAQLVENALLDELFLTIAPVLAGRDHVARHGLIAGLELLPDRRETGELLSVRSQGAYLFLRYGLG